MCNILFIFNHRGFSFLPPFRFPLLYELAEYSIYSTYSIYATSQLVTTTKATIIIIATINSLINRLIYLKANILL